MKIIQAKEKDIKTIATIKIGSQYKIYTIEPTTISKQQKKITKRFHSGFKYFLGFMQNVPACVVSLRKFKKIKNNKIKKIPKNSVEIFELFVLKKFQKKNCGTKLVKFAEKISKKTGANYLIACTWEHNTASKKFFHKLGFKKAGFKAHHFSNGDSLIVFTKQIYQALN